MSTRDCKAFLDAWLRESYEDSEPAQGQWRRVDKKKAEGGVSRLFENQAWELRVEVLEAPDGLSVASCEEGPRAAIAPNGWTFGVSPKDAAGPVCVYLTNEEMSFENVGNHHCGDCDGLLPEGLSEITESLFESELDRKATIFALERAGFVRDQPGFDRYFAEWEIMPSKPKRGP